MDFSKFRKLTWLKSLAGGQETDHVRLVAGEETAVFNSVPLDLVTKSQLKAGCPGKDGGEGCGCGGH